LASSNTKWAAVAFIAAHFITSAIYDLFVDSSGFAMHLSQSAVYIIISMMSISVALRLLALSISIVYISIAVNWFLLSRGVEFQIQELFYNNFYAIMNTLNLITLICLGWNNAVYIFNHISNCRGVSSRPKLRNGVARNHSILSSNISISKKNNKISERN